MKRYLQYAATLLWTAVLTAPGCLGQVGRVPTSACAKCHSKEATLFAATSMGQSLIPPAASLSPAKVTHQPSHSVITVEQRNGQMIHAISEDGLTAEYPVRYQIGGGLMGSSFMVQIGDYLFESPASWFKSYGWDISPGYESAPLVDFDRPMSDTCLFCHAGNARFADSDGRRLESPRLQAITCERCHGPGAEHIRHPSANNIVNPAKLTGAARDSVCEQCHLEAAGRVLNPGRRWSDYHPGQPAEKTFATYMLTGGDNHEIIAVSQVEQLAQSQCAQMSGGKLWCGSCHQPHSEVKDRQAQLRGVCTTCHTRLSAAAHSPSPAECTSCHMPRSPTTNVAHAALTDHRILRRPTEASQDAQATAQKVVAWREPAPAYRARDLGLAQVLAGFSKNLPPIAEEGFHRLQSLPPAKQNNDPEVLSALEGLCLQSGKLQEALRYGRQSVEISPRSAKAAMNFGLVLERSGDQAEAERQFSRAIQLDPSLKPAYSELARLYGSERRTQEMLETINRYLQWNPQDIMFRMQKARLEAAQ